MMYERFTDRARKVLQLANKEAQLFRHEYVGIEHLLLGLIAEGTGVAANVLKNLDIDLRKARLSIERLVQYGPDVVTINLLPQTPRLKKVIQYSIEEAKILNHNYIGTEHLLLGLLREPEGLAADALKACGYELDGVRQEVLDLLGVFQANETPIGKKRAEEQLQEIGKAMGDHFNHYDAVITIGKIRCILGVE